MNMTDFVDSTFNVTICNFVSMQKRVMSCSSTLVKACNVSKSVTV